MSATTTGLVSSGFAAKKAVENIVTDLYNLAKAEGKIVLKRWKATNHIESVYKKAKAIRLVKTLLQPEKEVDLSQFYYPSKVNIDSKKITITQLTDFGYDGNLVIEGTVGQGKSIFLRYLASVELFHGRAVPSFVELRKLKQGQTLISLVIQELKALGFDMDEELFGIFAKKGRVVLFLDAFDEVKEERQMELLSEIELHCRQFEKLRVVVTSRPNLGVSASPIFRVFRLSPLQGREYEQVVIRLAHNEKTAIDINDGIRKDSARLARLLTTPLMVALLLIRYRIDQSLPHNDASFYEALFSLLLQRHDKSKGGYVRPRSSKLSDSTLGQVFNALCYITRKAGESSFQRAQLVKHAVGALKIVGQTADVDSVLSDIINITCLIVTDGDECRFIHKSVQEYHAAVFIKDQPEESGAAFYKAMETRWSNWRQELRFLSVVDRYRFLKCFHIPQLRNLLQISGEVPQHIDLPIERILECCGDDQLAFSGADGGRPTSFTTVATGRRWPIAHLLHDDPSYVFEFFEIKLDALRDSSLKADDEVKVITVSDMLLSQACKPKVEEVCKKLFSKLLGELRDGEEYVAHVEKTRSIFDF